MDANEHRSRIGTRTTPRLGRVEREILLAAPPPDATIPDATWYDGTPFPELLVVAPPGSTRAVSEARRRAANRLASLGLVEIRYCQRARHRHTGAWHWKREAAGDYWWWVEPRTFSGVRLTVEGARAAALYRYQSEIGTTRRPVGGLT